MDSSMYLQMFGTFLAALLFLKLKLGPWINSIVQQSQLEGEKYLDKKYGQLIKRSTIYDEDVIRILGPTFTIKQRMNKVNPFIEGVCFLFLIATIFGLFTSINNPEGFTLVFIDNAIFVLFGLFIFVLGLLIFAIPNTQTFLKYDT